jgi:hypothetical protein
MINYDFWGSRPEYTITEAAYLGCGVTPIIDDKECRADVSHLSDQFLRGIARGEIKRSEVSRMIGAEFVFASHAYYVDRENLKRWFENNGMRPAFLFPEERPKPSDITQPSLSTRRRNSYLILIAGLCRHAGINPSEPGIAPALCKLIENAGDGTSLDEKTIRGILAEIPEALESRAK